MTHEHWIQGMTLVIGGTGKTGRRVADRLLKAGRLVRIGSRAAKLPFAWENRDTWGQVLQDVKAAYVTYQPDLAVPGARATGRDITFIPVSVDDYRTELVRQGVPDDYIELVLYLFTTLLDGRNTPLADGVQQALGRAPRSFSDYVQQTAATGIWGGNNV